MAKTIKVPLKGTNVKKGVNYIKTLDGQAAEVADDERAGRCRPTQHELSAVVAKSFEIIQTLGANKREMYIVAAGDLGLRGICMHARLAVL
jgi:hypothetical protein